MKRNGDPRMQEIRQFSRINCACVRAPDRVKSSMNEFEGDSGSCSFETKDVSLFQQNTYVVLNRTEYFSFNSGNFWYFLFFFSCFLNTS